jgi:threonylcarbamoyladenosine tRNA methylthiotransferase CDKAL1
MTDKKPKILIETYGCTMNQADSDMIEGILRERGYPVSALEDEADVIILNTCTVKGPTENRILERIKRLGSLDKKLVVAGCMSVNQDKVRKITDAPIVWPGAIGRIGEAVEDALCSQVTEYKDAERKEGLPAIVTKPIMRLAIAEGCVGMCSFCQTKLARPGLRSMRPQAVLKRIADGLAAGAKEIQLTAMDTGAYGLDIGTELPPLLDCINELDGPFLTRLGMINPDHALRMKEKLVTALNGKRFYKFLHIPVQSGSERVCKDMNRKHTVAEFEGIVRDLRKGILGITIATDVIVGYPTETERDYKDTLEMLGRVKPDITNVSRFSARPGTKAKGLRPLPTQEVKRRSTEASALVKRISSERNKELIGQTFEVLITEKQKDYTGRNISYKQVVVKDFEGELGEMVKVKIKDANHGSLFGIRE